MIAEEILSEIDATLERLIRNVETIDGANLTDLTEAEIDAFQKTQESLLHHLMHMDHVFETKRNSLSIKNERSIAYNIQKKHELFEKLTASVKNNIQKAEKKLPIFSKRNKKRLIYTARGKVFNFFIGVFCVSAHCSFSQTFYTERDTKSYRQIMKNLTALSIPGVVQKSDYVQEVP